MLSQMSGTLSWSNGDTDDKEILIKTKPINPGFFYPERTLIFTLSDPTGGAVIDPQLSTATLVFPEVPDQSTTSEENGGCDCAVAGPEGRIPFESLLVPGLFAFCLLVWWRWRRKF